MNFSPRIGRVFGIEVRLHWTLLVYAIFLAIWQKPQNAVEAGLFVGLLVMLFGSILLHEFGHVFAGRFCDGQSDCILLWPLGGLAFVNVPDSPVAHFFTALAGPLVTLAIWAGAVLVEPLTHGWVAYLLYRLAQMNLYMLLFNLIPAYPLDGGRMFQAALWHRLGHGRSMWISVHVSLALAVMMVLASFVRLDATQVNFVLVGVASFIFYQAWQERQLLMFEQTNAGYWSSRPGVAFNHIYRTEEPAPKRRGDGWFRRLFRRKPKHVRIVDDDEWPSSEEFIRKEVDPILDKIARDGMASLTRRERKILESAKDLMQKERR